MASASRPKLISLDAFSKTIEDAKVKTALGGIITLVCFFVVLFLIRNEYNDYKNIITLPTLVVDKDVNKPLDINFDITFPNIPCGVLTVDILDSSGDTKLDVLKLGFQQWDIIDGQEQEINTKTILSNEITLEELTKNGPDANGVCGSCYGALPQDNNEHCCNTCASIKLAYAEKEWAFYDGENIEQCEKEGYVRQLQDSINNNLGCRIKGTTQINRLSGNLHFAPGSSLTGPGQHIHDISLYNKYPDKFNFDHIINGFLFGSPIPKDKETPGVELTHPLNGYRTNVDSKYHVFLYYLKVVATRFEYLLGGWTDTNQFLVVTHDRPMVGGKDHDHQHTIHSRGGMPGVFFYFDISPLKIINKEQHAKTWSGFLLGVVSSIAGVLMVGALLDRSVFVAEQAIKLKKNL